MPSPQVIRGNSKPCKSSFSTTNSSHKSRHTNFFMHINTIHSPSSSHTIQNTIYTMATVSKATLLSFSISWLVIFSVGLAQTDIEGEQGSSSKHHFGSENKCQIQRLKAQRPSKRIESEAGVTEFFDENDQQFECAGVAAHRRVIEPRGLLLPLFYNAPALVYIVKGRGIVGLVVPGCPESFQSFQQQQEDRQGHGGTNDQHQRVNQFREGDVLAIPAGVAHWIVNNGVQPVVAFTVLDTSNNANQLDQNRREFLLAGRKQSGQRSSEDPSHREENSGDNILHGFDTESLAEVMGINKELAEKLKSRNDDRGEIVRVDREFQIVRPRRSDRREEQEEEEGEGERQRSTNGLDQAFCTMKIKYNIDDQTRADIYNPNAGRTITLNSRKLTILKHLQLNAVRGVLRQNAFIAPHWNNAHSIMYATQGSARLQIVGNRGHTAFDGELRRGQLIVVPQNYALMIQATSQEFEWVAIKTNDLAVISPVVGKASVFKGLPEEVLRNAFRLSREEAKRVKYNRGEEMVVFQPSFSGSSRGKSEA